MVSLKLASSLKSVAFLAIQNIPTAKATIHIIKRLKLTVLEMVLLLKINLIVISMMPRSGISITKKQAINTAGRNRHVRRNRLRQIRAALSK